ncbi:hybrid sensor histidine kinase/response regulator [Roseivirga misakiensis]|uniref:histidine kinase n=1 Tax=Roseivirga misakiensis TaxID=1563681 RepID=A0A1E5SYI3_9BACT|nr:hybrid sensor histidine kinase/response regulator [Roseivirga misakiensis]OEK04172.1 hypothetical protein BFP71_11860 [Roseivirga misakiensis]
MHRNKLLLLTLFLLSTLPIAAQQGFYENIQYLSSDEEEVTIGNRILLFEDKSKVMDIDSIQRLKPQDFTSFNNTKELNKLSNYWTYFQLKNQSRSELSFILKGGINAKETYYLVVDNQVTDVKKTGYHFPVDTRDIKRGHQTRINISIPTDKTLHLYVKIESTDNSPIDVQARLIPADQWQSKFEKDKLFQGLFSGVLLIFSIVTLFIYGFTKERVFLFFGLYTAVNLVYFLYLHGLVEFYFLPQSTNYLSILWLLPLLSAAAYVNFTRHFLATESEFPKWEKFVKVLPPINVFLFVVGCSYLLITGDFYHSLMGTRISLILLLLFAMTFMVRAWLSKNIIAKYYAYGTLLFVTSLLLFLANQLTSPSHDLPIIVQIGILLETVIFSLGVSHKLKRQFEDHNITQRSLILQLKKNEELQLNTNQELEEIVADRTQQIKKQNIALEKAQKLAEKATKEKSDFLSVMSHEIRTPLNAIISLSHIMEMDNKDREMKEYIDALKFSAEGLHSLVNDILDHNKMEAGKLRLENIEFSLIDLLKNLGELFKYKANNQGLELRIEIGEHLPDRLLGDPTRLAQILTNLISNAIKFTAEGYVHIKASLAGVKDDTATVSFAISDTGIGIPEDKLKSIFEDFEQASNEITREYGGTGLGLSIVKNLLKMMGSTIELKSQKEVGSCFAFDIDFGLDPNFQMIDLQQQDRDKDLKALSILVIDDNDMNRLVLKRLLQIWNGGFTEVDNGVDAVEMCKETSYDLILTDLEMKPMNGFDTAIKISKTSKNRQIPIIAMSAHNPLDFEIEYKEAGFVDFVHKPFDPEELFQKITAVTGAQKPIE